MEQTMQLEKQKIKVEIIELIKYTYPSELKAHILVGDRIVKEKGLTNFTIQIKDIINDDYTGSKYYTVLVTGERDETEEEYKARVHTIEMQILKEKARAFVKFEKLKQRWGF